MSYINLWHIMTFEALTSGTSDCFGLIPCYVGETPSTAIAMFHRSSTGVDIVPLFVALTGDMDLTIPEYCFQHGNSARGQRHDTIHQQFTVNAALAHRGQIVT